jgi:hypothetical protein
MKSGWKFIHTVASWSSSFVNYVFFVEKIRDIHNNTAEDDAQRGGFTKIVELLQKWAGEEIKFGKWPHRIILIVNI